MTDTAAFKEVLHEWARRQLETRSDHTGPFEIVKVEMVYSEGFGGSDVTPSSPDIVDIYIKFKHDEYKCARARKTLPQYEDIPCRESTWSPYDSRDTVTMLNELLVITDGAEC